MFITDSARGRAEFANVHLLITDTELTTVGQVSGVMDTAVARKLTPLAVFARRIRAGALAFLTVNKLRGLLPVIGVQVTPLPEQTTAALHDLAHATGKP